MKKRVKDLVPGDVMNGSGETVEGVTSGTRTPAGKIEVALAKDGKFRIAIWGRQTLVGVKESSNV